MKLNKSNSDYFLNFISIKTLIFILIFCLLSTKIFGAVNDVYYCEMDNLIMIKDNKQDSYQAQKFKFTRFDLFEKIPLRPLPQYSKFVLSTETEKDILLFSI